MILDRRIKVARILLERGDPLPVDLTTYLLSEGVDVSTLERRFAAQ